MSNVTVSVKNDIDKMVAHFEQLSAGLKGQATMRALNRTADMARTEASRQIRSEYRMKARDVNAAIKVVKATPRSTTFEARIVAKGPRSIPVIDFSARQTKRGVSIAIKKAGGRKLFAKGFIATMKNGHRGVFERKGKSRLPIQELFTIGVPYQFAARKTIEAMGKIVRDKFPDRLRHELEQAVKRNGGSVLL